MDPRKPIPRRGLPGVVTHYALVLAAALLIPSVARAQDAKAVSKDAAEGEAAPAVQVERGAGGRKVYRITTEFRIEGRIQKPTAFYVLDRQSVNYEWAALKQDFMPRIVDSVKEAPF